MGISSCKICNFIEDLMQDEINRFLVNLKGSYYKRENTLNVNISIFVLVCLGLYFKPIWTHFRIIAGRYILIITP